jgi:hypothetical protein
VTATCGSTTAGSNATHAFRPVHNNAVKPTRIVNAIIRLRASITPVTHECAIVFIHGTVSCGIQQPDLMAAR